ncbi:MAG: OmpA family protein [Limnobacter sp.]|nr:OmpA family protein [Limnobacter sp.]
MGSSELPKGLKAQLAVFSNVLARRGASAAEIEVTGHADASGDEQFNQWLSVRRAESVKAYLVERGVSADLLVIRGKGSAQLAKPASPYAAANRRIEIGRLAN